MQLDLDLFSTPVQEEIKIEPKPSKTNIKSEILKYEKNWQPKTKFIEMSLDEVRKKTPHGWLLPYLFQIESMINGRWEFWVKANQIKSHSLLELMTHGVTEKFLETNLYHLDYPQIDFNEQSKVIDYLYSILSIMTKAGASLQSSADYFFSWLLYGFGHENFTERPTLNIRKNVEVQLYQYVDLFPFICHPADYFNPVMAEVFPVKQNKEKGFFPTPMSVCTAMNKILNPDTRLSNNIMNEPCAGTGSLVLAYSNSGGMCVITTELQELVAKAQLINYYFYCPQYARPLWYLLDNNAVIWGNSLTLEVFEDYHSKYRTKIKQDIKKVLAIK